MQGMPKKIFKLQKHEKVLTRQYLLPDITKKAITQLNSHAMKPSQQFWVLGHSGGQSLRP